MSNTTALPHKVITEIDNEWAIAQRLDTPSVIYFVIHRNCHFISLAASIIEDFGTHLYTTYCIGCNENFPSKFLTVLTLIEDRKRRTRLCNED